MAEFQNLDNTDPGGRIGSEGYRARWGRTAGGHAWPTSNAHGWLERVRAPFTRRLGSSEAGCLVQKPALLPE